MLTQERVKQLFDYKDGNLYRKNLNNRTKAGPIGTNNGVNYQVVKIDGVKHYVHRVVFFWNHGHLPVEIDHIDCNRANNKIENLRASTRSQNAMNRGVTKRNPTGIKGVFYLKASKNYRAEITVCGKRVRLGHFSDANSAMNAYNQAAMQHHGVFAKHANNI